MRRFLSGALIGAASLAAASLAGCAGPWTPAGPMATTEAPNPIQVSVSRLTHSVRVRGGQLAPADAAELARFVEASDATRGERASVLRGTAPADVAGANRVATELARLGLAPVVVATPERSAGSVEVVIERYVAAAPDCPNWTKPPGADNYNHMPSDFGCATQNNLAAMVVDPHDLIAGRDAGPLVGDAAARPTARYRAGVIPPLPNPTSSGSAPAAAAPAAGAASAGAPPSS